MIFIQVLPNILNTKTWNSLPQVLMNFTRSITDCKIFIKIILIITLYGDAVSQSVNQSTC